MADENDSTSEVSSQSWGSRLMASIKGVAVGALLFIAAFPILFWNEGRAVKTAQSLKEGAKSLVAVQGAKVEAANDGKLVHVTGAAVTTEKLACDVTGLSVAALRLDRTVEMYQWIEEKESKTEKQLGGSEKTVTTYKYKKGWSESFQDSSKFKKSESHPNPASMMYKSALLRAQEVKLGDFTLSESLVGSIPSGKALPVKAEDLSQAGSAKAQLKVQGDGSIYIGNDPAAPQVGDYRIRYEAQPSGAKISVVSRQFNQTFTTYKAKNGYTVEMLRMGEVPGDSMFQEAKEGNSTMTWILRLLGLVVMAIGLGMVFNPLATLADVIPFLGSILRGGIGIFAVLVSLPLTLITIAIAWLFYRPILAICLIAAGVGIVMGARALFKKRKAAAPAA